VRAGRLRRCGALVVIGVFAATASGCGGSGSASRLAQRVVPKQSDLGPGWERVPAAKLHAPSGCLARPAISACALSYFVPSTERTSQSELVAGAVGLATVYPTEAAARAAFERAETQTALARTIRRANATQSIALTSRTSLSVAGAHAIRFVLDVHVLRPVRVGWHYRVILIQKAREVVLLTVTSPKPLSARAVAARIARRM